jgi:hypothetical protein
MLTREKELLERVEKHKEVIVFGAGLCGSALVRYLVEKGYADGIFCVAVSDKNGNPDDLMGIPVCALADIEERGGTALVLIAALEGLHAEMRGVLARHGFQNVAALSNLCHAEIRRARPGYGAEIYADMRRMLEKLCEMDARLTSLAYRVAERPEIVAVNTAAFGGCKDLYVGREVAIVATGATLNDYRPIEGAVHIGMNTAYRYQRCTLDYLFVQDFNRDAFREYYGEGYLKEYIQDIAALRCKKFVGMYSEDCPHRHIRLSESDLARVNAVRYFVDIAPSEEIYENICFHPLMDFFSVVFPAVHFALFTNPRRIYLVGCDLLADGKYRHFDDEGEGSRAEDRVSSVAEFQKNTAWPKVKAFAAQHYPDTEIVSVNPVGLKGLFRDLYTK